MPPAQHASTAVHIPHPGKRCRRHEIPELCELHLMQQGLKAGIIPKHVMRGIYVRHGQERIPFQPGGFQPVESRFVIPQAQVDPRDGDCWGVDGGAPFRQFSRHPTRLFVITRERQSPAENSL